jgi:SNF2 family DNA or RNA helicase
MRCGIFADDMCLGKTLTLLSLIATTKSGGERTLGLVIVIREEKEKNQ